MAGRGRVARGGRCLAQPLGHLTDTVGYNEPGQVSSPNLARLLWRPFLLPYVARDTASIPAIALAILALLCLPIIPLTLLFAGIDEPYTSIAIYSDRVRNAIPRVLRLLVIFLGFPAAVLAFFVSFAFPSDRAYARLFLFAAIPFIGPVLIWSAAAIPLQLHQVLTAGKPSWVQSPIFAVAGSPLWLLLMLAAFLVYVGWSTAKLRRILDSPTHCGRCGYPLRGLRHLRCPECGYTTEVA